MGGVSFVGGIEVIVWLPDSRLDSDICCLESNANCGALESVICIGRGNVSTIHHVDENIL